MLWYRSAVLGFALVLVSPALAQPGQPVAEPLPQAEPDDPGNGAFEQGQIVVTGKRPEGLSVAGSTLGQEAIRLFSRNTLDDAAALLPGVSASNTGGSRNERLIFVRGFDRLQVPLLIDGVRIFLPADNRIDYGRFLTPDIAEVQVAKGYPSVLDGPGALGGAINLVTREPDDPIELEARGQLLGDRRADYGAHNAFLSAGTRQDGWWGQASYARNDRDHFTVSDAFTPTANEDGGRRGLSQAKDWRVSLRIAATPNDSDEYAIGFTRQEGAKNAPIETNVPLPVQRFWSWPSWNVESATVLTTTRLTDTLVLKGRAYRNRFGNLLRAYDDRGQTRQSLPRAFNSTYEDEAYGGSAAIDWLAAPGATVRLAAHGRRDRHREYQQLFPSGLTEPAQDSVENVWSLAGEAEFALAEGLSARLGVSRDWRDLKRAEDFSGVPGTATARFLSYPARDDATWNAQGRLDWQAQERIRLSVSLSARARFPTLFERFSSRFGGATSSPGLGAERATQGELAATFVSGRLRFEGSGFYARLSDAIFAFPTAFYTCTNGFTPPATPTLGCGPQAVTQSRNIGKGTYYGAELGVAADLSPRLSLGGNYGWVRRDLADPSNAAFRPVGVPTHKLFAYLDWRPLPRLRLLPSFELASDRWLVNSAGTRYFRDGALKLANLRAEYQVTRYFSLGLVARNLLDENYQVADGFPEEGRSLSLDLRASY